MQHITTNNTKHHFMAVKGLSKKQPTDTKAAHERSTSSIKVITGNKGTRASNSENKNKT